MNGAATGRLAIRTRERRPDLPNFRDHGLTVDRDLLRLVGNLQRKHGYACVSESSLRAMIHQDTGHMPGVGTVPAALRRLEARGGYVEVRWIHKGSLRPDGNVATVGSLRVRLVYRAERRAVTARARQVNRRLDVGGRVGPPAIPTIPSRELPRVATDGRVGSEEKRARDLARLAEWAAREGVT